MNRHEHWNSIYQTKGLTDVSWFESDPQVSLELIDAASPTHGSVIDVGGGTSRLVDNLVAARFESVAVLDISEIAIQHTRARLGVQAEKVRWIVGDITQVADLGQYDVWHDRAVFHFLTDNADRLRYVDLAARTVRVGGHLIIGTFAIDGPQKCSGLDVCRYDAASLSRVLGSRFKLIKGVRHQHVTPSGKPQQFFFGVFQHSPQEVSPGGIPEALPMSALK